MRNLLGRLVTRTNAQLSAIAAFWDVTITHTDPHRDAGLLYPVLTDPWALALVWERFPPVARQILQMATETLTLTETALLHLPDGPAAVKEGVHALLRAGLLFVETSDQRAAHDERGTHYILPAEIAHLVKRLAQEREQPLTLNSSLAEALATLTDAEVLALAERLGMRVLPATTSRQEALSFCQTALADPAHRTQLARRRSGAAQRLWDWLVGRGGLAAPAVAQHALGLRLGQLRVAVHELADYGLLWRSYRPDGELRLLVPKAFQPQATATATATTLSPGRTDVAALTIPFIWPVAWDVIVTLQTLEWVGGRWQPTAAPAALLQRALPLLWIVDQAMTPSGYLAWLCQVCLMLGLLTPQGQLVEPAWERWRRLSFADQTRRLLQAWIRAATVPSAGEAVQRPTAIPSWPAFKRALLATLRTLPPYSWQPIDAVVHWCLQQLPEHARLSAPFLPGSEEHRVAHRAVLALLRTSLRWLGILEHGQASDGTPVIQLGNRGCWLLGLQPSLPAQEAQEGTASFTADGRCTLSLPQRPAALYTLLCLSDIIQRGPPLIVHFSRKRLTEALQHGWDPNQAMEALRQAVGVDFPEAFAKSIAHWLASRRPAYVQRACVITFPDHETLREADERLRRAGLQTAHLEGHQLCVWSSEASQGATLLRRVQAILRAAGLQPKSD